MPHTHPNLPETHSNLPYAVVRDIFSLYSAGIRQISCEKEGATVKLYCAVFCLSFFLTLPARAAAQQPEVKFIADTLVVQAEGSYESDPDVALMTFDVMAQEKELK